MATTKKSELAIAGCMLAVGIGYLLMTTQLPHHSGIDATFVPYLLSTLLCALGALHLLAVVKMPQTEGSVASDETPSEPMDVKAVVKTLALIVGYIALLKTVGFPIMTTVYLYLQFIVLTPVNQKVNHVVYVLIALITTAVVYTLFREAFDLLLPSGLFGF
ncbi:tripartite tricarboxylate transporter TctB family protein [Pseudomonas sp. NPDC078700]|uniref:tripartite tricarboxylate transporter TctB family protein n=1 Tax=Pseudomonas sp. NPDC078700 TaxID=3364424 RepID=UPI0037C78D42